MKKYIKPTILNVEIESTAILENSVGVYADKTIGGSQRSKYMNTRDWDEEDL